MTLVIGSIKDVSGVPDNSVWRFSSVLRENYAGNGIVTTKTVTATPVAGALSVSVDPGFVIVNYKGKDYNVTVPNQASVDVWDLIAIVAPLPTSTVTAFGNSLATATGAADALSKLGVTSGGLTSTGVLTGSRLASTVATGTAPLTVASSTVVANLNASSVAGYGPAQTAAANTLAARDGNTNLQARGFIPGFTSTVTSATTVTLIASSSHLQEFTGTIAQTVVLPTAGVVAGQSYKIINNSTGTVTVQSSALATVSTISTGTEGTFTALVATPTTAAHWEDGYYLSLTAAQTATNKTFTTPTLTTPVINGISTGTGVSVASTINTLGLRDGSGRMFAHNFVPVFTTTATAAGTTTLVNSHGVQEFTGTTTQTCVLPTTGVSAGQSFTIINNSTGAVTVQSSALAAVGAALTTGTSATFTALIATPTTAANWHRR